MELLFTEQTDKAALLAAYEVYKTCMYRPTMEKYEKKIDAYLQEEAVGVFTCTQGSTVLGMIVGRLDGKTGMEILGIAVNTAVRKRGIGAYMIERLVNAYALCTVTAETDDDAVGFYRKCGFCITEYTEDYDGKPVTRYHCKWMR